MDQDTQVAQDGPTDGKSGKMAALTSRRSLLRAGAGAAPVLLTLASGPVSATGSCTVASSYVSANTFKSRTGGTSITCVANNCNYWVSQANNYPSCGTWEKAKLEAKIYTHFLSSAGTFYDKNCKELFQNGGAGIASSGAICIVQHLVAVSIGGAFDKSYITSIWTNYNNNGGRYILSASGINWSELELISWLKKLQGL